MRKGMKQYGKVAVMFGGASAEGGSLADERSGCA